MPKVANSELWGPGMRKALCERGPLTFIWKDRVALGGRETTLGKYRMCKGGEAGENVVPGEPQKGREGLNKHCVWERRRRQTGGSRSGGQCIF